MTGSVDVDDMVSLEFICQRPLMMTRTLSANRLVTASAQSKPSVTISVEVTGFAMGLRITDWCYTWLGV